MNERKIRWKSWLLMLMAKKMGGLGFKNLEMFNNALLAKQCRRMVMEPDALWARVLKGIYFLNGEIMKARKGGRASYTWSSLLVGIDFLKNIYFGRLWMDMRCLFGMISRFHGCRRKELVIQVW